MNPSELSIEELVALVEELQEQVSVLEAENERLREENEALRETVEEQATTISKLKAALNRYDNAHTPPSKQQSGRSASDETDDDAADEDGRNQARTDGGTGTVGRTPGHEAVWRDLSDIDEVIDVTLECCPDCGHDLGEEHEQAVPDRWRGDVFDHLSEVVGGEPDSALLGGPFLEGLLGGIIGDRDVIGRIRFDLVSRF